MFHVKRRLCGSRGWGSWKGVRPEHHRRSSDLRPGQSWGFWWPKSGLICWGFDENVSRETFLVQENKTRIACLFVDSLTSEMGLRIEVGVRAEDETPDVNAAALDLARARKGGGGVQVKRYVAESELRE
jgi:hypothetical protein